MNDVSNDRQQRFQVLLQQLKLTEDAVVRHFQHAEIEKLTVERQARRWHFSFLTEAIIPCDVLTMFSHALQQAFQQIANISFSVNVHDASYTEQLILDYWKFCIKELEGISPPLLALLNDRLPTVQGNKIVISVSNDMEGITLKRKYSEWISQVYQNYGFPPLVLDTVISKENKEEEFQKFLEAKQKEDAERAQQAVIEMQKRESASEEDDAVHDGPLMIGLTIKEDADFRRLEEIQDEERRIAIEGYVFDAETKELRSGRTLLTFKITDYTDSILVKMFSRDKEDAALLNRVKKGMWLRVRGGIQNDTFVRDLVMIANDINEIRPITRMDTAPDEEKRVELHLHTPMSQMDAVTSVSDLISQAKKWGHKAIAVTDHAVAQSFPEAYSAGKKNGIKILYGVEANLVDDGVPIAYNDAHRLLADDTFVVFDVETTGL
ncbi:MAG TPA: PolC-type DNA polymerase III N-terminal domain-containing protein, partial [Chondromyces sp.]|nr:PolC-type DNA polymerase III N-terminal domain-containing protein [Chondromyces sp.]